jgi:hypothetical protein
VGSRFASVARHRICLNEVDAAYFLRGLTTPWDVPRLVRKFVARAPGGNPHVAPFRQRIWHLYAVIKRMALTAALSTHGRVPARGATEWPLSRRLCARR